MGTKANPGQFDCYAAAADDEPLFVLRANDPLAPSLLRIWVELRDMNFPWTTVLPRARKHEADKLREALQCADAMAAWRKAQDEAKR